MLLPPFLCRSCLGAAVAALLLATLATDAAPPAPPTEYDVKAKLLVVFSRYVEWPAGAFASEEAPIVTCIWGTDPFGRVIDEATTGRRSHGRLLEVRRLTRISELEDCHLLYVPRAEAPRQRALLAALEGKPILKVGESDRFLEDGGDIRLELGEDHHLVYDVDRDAVDGAGLKVRSFMLERARAVTRAGGTP